MAANMLSLTIIRFSVQLIIHLWNLNWRRDVRTRYVFILPIWDILYVAISNMEMEMILAIACAFMPMCFASIIPLRISPWSLRLLSHQNFAGL